MEKQATELQAVMVQLGDIEKALLMSDQAKTKVVAVMYALERIGQAKMLIGRAQTNLLGEVAKEQGETLDDFNVMLGPGMTGNHALVHNPLSYKTA
ncbi:hypothetical protein [Mesorhizobium sp.]|uniref:hypothetical protein n=1 Tax=Mesorhizobium sp. TaxID=1871066 RepID=UPI000FE661C5|nr:hypothetical protein [Mesorhizobium sp.]RWP37987.1 MAG: hypothetical protein EOR03_03540 [Mesorhizobium sp.]